MAPTRVLIDACVLYDAAVRDLLLRLGIAGLIEPIWSARILDECFTALGRNRPDLTIPQMESLRAAMSRAFPMAEFPAGSYSVVLPDPNDVHVVGSAVAGDASLICTYNLTDFPALALHPHGLVASHPDALALTILEADEHAVLTVLVDHVRALRRPPTTLDRLLATLDARGLIRFVAAARVALAKRG
jgi:PIN domain